MRLSRPPHFRSLRAFCIAARHRSFKIAADELFLTPSAVSHQIKELEEALGVRLFERKTRAVELTSAGHALLDEIDPLLEALDRGLARIARRNRRAVLRLALPPFFAHELFLPQAAAFCAAHPGIDIQVDTHDPRPAAHSPGADLTVLIAEAAPAGLKATRLFPTRLVAVCAAQHAATVARLGAGTFRETTLITHKSRPTAWSSWALEVGLEEPEPRNVVELDTMIAIVRAAERGAGIALVPEALCAGAFASGRLVRIFPAEPEAREAYFLVCRAKDAARPAIAAMSRWIEEHCGTRSNVVQGAPARTLSEQLGSQTSSVAAASD